MILSNLNNEVLDVEPEKFIVKEGFGYGAQGYSSGMLVIRRRKKWGAIDNMGRTVVPVKYDFLSKFIDGYATARLNENNNNNNIIDSDGYVSTNLNNNYYIIDSIGNEIQIKEKDITIIRMFSEGLVLIKNEDGLMGYVNLKGETVIPLIYRNCGYFKSGLAWARNSEGKIGYINKSGEWVIEPEFLAVKDFDPVSQLAKARVNETWGFINKKGEIRYIGNVKKIYDYSEGLAMAVTLDGLFGFLDENQKWIIEPQFNAARDFKNGYATARLDGKWGIIDKSGEWIIEPNYSGIKDVIKVLKQ